MMRAANWQDPPKRERKMRLATMSEADYYKSAMRRGGGD